jgi:hypothetical protein
MLLYMVRLEALATCSAAAGRIAETRNPVSRVVTVGTFLCVWDAPPLLVIHK